jgi:YfiH family protein
VLAWHERFPGGGLAVTDRIGGRSTGRYSALNLGDHVGDDPAAVEANRASVAEAVGVPPERLLVATQVHGADVAVVDRPWAGPPPQVDGLVTRERGLALAVLVADCTPVLLADPDQAVVGVAHAGRKGLASGIVPAVLAAMRDLGAGTVLAQVGPSVCGRCYEVPLALREEVAAVAPEARSVTRRGTPALDIAAGVVAQLAALDVSVEWLPGCSVEREDLYSHRRDAVTGRYAGVAWLDA